MARAKTRRKMVDSTASASRKLPQSRLRSPLKGHAHSPLYGERKSGRTDPDSELHVTLVLRRRFALPDVHFLGERPVHQRQHLSREALARRHGHRADDLAMVKRFAREHQLHLGEVDPARRTVVLTGKARNMERAFAVSLVQMQHPRGSYRAVSGRPSLPRELDGIVETVLGLSTRPCARRSRVHHTSTTKPFWTVLQMARAYGFPREFGATGQTIALIELGGGYHDADLRKFFTHLRRPMPSISCVSIDGTTNSPAPAKEIRMLLDVIEGKRKLSDLPQEVLAAAQSTLEVTMDIELAAALAPGAEIVVYMTPNTEQGIYHAVSRALREGKNLPCALSISWGEPEPGVSKAYLDAVDDVLRDAAMLGVTVCVSSGDEGAMNGATDGKPVVNFPASSPHVLSCGGSSVHFPPGHLRESVWNCVMHGMHGASGGGVSRHFQPPPWQKTCNVPLGPTGRRGRGVPDVAGPADPRQGCEIIAGQARYSSAGTSAVAPLWAALIACLNTQLESRCGYITPLLYRIAAGGSSKPLRDITRGNNGFYDAAPGWNACTGLGSPMVDLLIEALRPPGSSSSAVPLRGAA